MPVAKWVASGTLGPGAGGLVGVVASEDGLTWSAVATPFSAGPGTDSEAWQPYWDSGLWVMAGFDAFSYSRQRVMTSPDGFVWTEATSLAPAPSSFDRAFTVVKGDKWIVPTQLSNEILSSPDGALADWSATTGNIWSGDPTVRFVDCSVQQGLYIAAGQGFTTGPRWYCFAASGDGLGWDPLPTPMDDAAGGSAVGFVVQWDFIHNRWILAGQAKAGGTVNLLLFDGMGSPFTALSVPLTKVYGIAVGPASIVAVGDGSSNPHREPIILSTDGGLTWRTVSTPLDNTGQVLNSVAWGEGVFITGQSFGSGNCLLRSTDDGLTWGGLASPLDGGALNYLGHTGRALVGAGALWTVGALGMAPEVVIVT